LVCSDRPIDAVVLQSTTLPWTPLPARPLRRTPSGLLHFARGFLQARARVERLLQDNDIDAVLLLGGFVAAPALSAALRKKIPTLLLNLDAVPGRANRWMARRATSVCTAMPTVHPLPSRSAVDCLEGVPIRRQARPANDKAHCTTAIGLDPHRRTLLITGASQGASSINQLFASALKRAPKVFDGWQVLHLTGPDQLGAMQQAWAAAGVQASVEPFRQAMADAWGAADLVVARAGASTVAEARFAGVPALYLPYPHHRDRHQWHNAAASVAQGTARVLKDHNDPDLTWPSFALALSELLQGDALEVMRLACEPHKGCDGATAVAERLLLLADDSAGATLDAG
jgi:UDP-N-acetylglucosamine--N-acetylmuramyl-(pentapeptide) pyrophosphoryl-undecaprenol N-acetylglucosamine transferase